MPGEKKSYRRDNTPQIINKEYGHHHQAALVNGIYPQHFLKTLYCHTQIVRHYYFFFITFEPPRNELFQHAL